MYNFIPTPPVIRPAFPPFSEIQFRYAYSISPSCYQLYAVVIVANGCGYTQGPFWLPWRIALVGQENQIEDKRFLFSPLTTPPIVAAKTRIQHCLCRDIDEIWQCRTGRNLTTFDKDHGTTGVGAKQRQQGIYGYSLLHNQLPPLPLASVGSTSVATIQQLLNWLCYWCLQREEVYSMSTTCT